MPPIKAVVFDFIGTLTNLKNYSLEASNMKLYKALLNSGFEINSGTFLEAYNKAYQKYRVVRYRKLVEVTNAVWISEALNNLGFKTTPNSLHIKTAVNIFFEDYLSSLQLRSCTKKLLKKLSTDYKLGLVSNFTYSPVTYAALRRLNINRFFNAVLVSDEVGCRKPHPKIFKQALNRLKVSPQETIYVGDSPLEDVKGAKDTGIKVVFVPSQFYTLKNLHTSQQKPHTIIKDLCELSKNPTLLEIPPNKTT